ncbi:uncharacterized protein YoxC [Psychromicrobium silvestre]|uniref:Uncharacterized protein YoxC n=1 Tax=Psychromicrobium silvestre TaxID=1645614 RepID=A0A7Y9S4C0_9MICC|nr:DUF948 domain-containing protein [Psychromicrobium silvestre]NYE94324.1 uncharacterized protein YoxC [Psychromicrobium silvestre]
MSGGDIAGLIAAGVFAILVAILAVPVFKLGKVFDELSGSIRALSEETTPLIGEVTATVTTTNEQLKKVDGMTSNVSDATANISALSSLIAATVGSPLIKVASFSYGVRQAFTNRKKDQPRAKRSR